MSTWWRVLWSLEWAGGMSDGRALRMSPPHCLRDAHPDTQGLPAVGDWVRSSEERSGYRCGFGWPWCLVALWPGCRTVMQGWP